MGFSWELVAVGLLVAAAGAWAVRSLVRAMKKPGGCSSCAVSGSCPAVKGSDGGSCAEDAEGESSRRGVALH